MNILGLGKTAGKVAFNLMKIGAWGVGQQYTQENFRKQSNGFIGEMERGTEHTVIKLKQITRN